MSSQSMSMSTQPFPSSLPSSSSFSSQSQSFSSPEIFLWCRFTSAKFPTAKDLEEDGVELELEDEEDKNDDDDDDDSSFDPGSLASKKPRLQYGRYSIVDYRLIVSSLTPLPVSFQLSCTTCSRAKRTTPRCGLDSSRGRISGSRSRLGLLVRSRGCQIS